MMSLTRREFDAAQAALAEVLREARREPDGREGRATGGWLARAPAREA